MQKKQQMKLRNTLDDILKEYIRLFEEKHEAFFEFAVEDDLMGIICFGDWYFNISDIIYDIDNDLPKNLIFKWQEDHINDDKNPERKVINLQSYARGLRFEDLNK